MAKLIGMRGSGKSIKPQLPPHQMAIPLGVAHKHGVTCELSKPASLSSCELMLCNSTKEPRSVELTGSYLVPQDSGYQRLLIAGANQIADTFVRMGAGESRSVTLETCCMDRPLTPPSGAQKYTIAPEMAPERLVNAARKFVRTKSPSKADTNIVSSLCQLDDVQKVCWAGQ